MTGKYIAVDSNKLEQIKNNQLDISDLDDNSELDIDKSWQAIHFLLCDTIAEGELPLGNVVPMREQNVLDVETDYVALFALTPEQVCEAYNSIKNIEEKELRMKYSFGSFLKNEIYPVKEDEDGDAFFDYIYEKFKLIQEFYHEASDNKCGIVFYIM